MFGSNSGQKAGSDSGASGEGPVVPRKEILGQKPLIQIFSGVHQEKMKSELKSKEEELKKKIAEIALLSKNKKSATDPEVVQLQEEVETLRKAIERIKDGIC